MIHSVTVRIITAVVQSQEGLLQASIKCRKGEMGGSSCTMSQMVIGNSPGSHLSILMARSKSD